jgi:hypothetical protein
VIATVLTVVTSQDFAIPNAHTGGMMSLNLNTAEIDAQGGNPVRANILLPVERSAKTAQNLQPQTTNALPML